MIDKLAQKHNLSRDAIQHLAQAMQQGNGTQAQFNHPELGGMGQWQNGMIMIGDAFNMALKAKISAVCEELARAYRNQQSDIFERVSSMPPMHSTRWWSDDFGTPSSAGTQNNIAYAIFPDKHRLLIRQNETITHYDTQGYQLKGVSQQQSNRSNRLVFTTQDGQAVTSADFKVVD